MPALFFPNLAALRFALTSGLVPPEIARASADAGTDAHRRLWLKPRELPSREALAGLTRVGVQVLGAVGVPTNPVSCWAELLPLQPTTAPVPERVLFLIPDRQLARFLARLRKRDHGGYCFRLPESAPVGLGWVTVDRPPAAIVAECAEPQAPIEAFREQTAGLWVRHGWQHPLPELFPVPPECVLLLRPDRAPECVAEPVASPEQDEYALRRATVAPVPSRPATPVSVRLTLVPGSTPTHEALWLFDATGEARFWEFCAATDQRVANQLEAASVGSGSATRLIVRAVGKKALPFILPEATGYARDPRLAGLFVPASRVLKPLLRLRELSQALGVKAGRIVWVEAAAGGEVVSHAVAETAFRRVAEFIEYAATPITKLEVPPRNDPFALERFVVRAEPITPIESERPGAPVAAPEPVLDLADLPASEPGWLFRSLRRLVAKLLPHRDEPGPPLPPAPATPAAPNRPAPNVRRSERTLASPDALLHGHDWTARRRELEARLFHDLPRLGPDSRAERWADLAAVYSATGKPADAAICWLNAIWESPSAPAEWLEDWLAAECRAAKFPDAAAGLERWLSEPGRAGVGRVVAAYIAGEGLTSTASLEFRQSLPRLLAFLEQHFDDLPVRAAWLARLGATRQCDGDALGLARWRDRVLTRLNESGPGLDLDEPSFLRFHGTASAERFQTAREWLERVRPQAVKWVQEQGDGGQLQYAGLDAETECTAAYSNFLFAWGLGCLGERSKAREVAAKARKVVSLASGRGTDPAAHAMLGDLFVLRMKEAQEGRTAKAWLPAPLQARLEALPERARFAVDRLRQRSRVLEPLDRVRPYRGQDLKLFWGSDRLGERLLVLAGRTDRDQIADETESLLHLCAESPHTATVPRIVLTLLELGPRLAAPALLRVLDLVPTAIEWLEAWVAAGPWGQGERPRRVVEYQARVLESAFATAGALPGAAGAPAVEVLVRRLGSQGDSLNAPLFAVGNAVFRSLRRLRLRAEAEALVRRLDPNPGAPEPGTSVPPARLGLAIGWLTAGHDEIGNRIIDEARDALYLAANRNDAERTALAIAYAEALGFADPRIALGRLEELFQRLGRVKVTGATTQYFTLQPLHLIDTVIRSVVTDEFTLGVAVRSWLDDDEFLIRGRIHRDLATVLREQGIS